MDESLVITAFSPYGTLTAAKRVNQTLWMLTYGTLEDAQWLVENLNGNIPQGMSSPVTVRFAQLGPAQPQGVGFAGGMAGGFRASPYGGAPAPALQWKGGCGFGMGSGPAAGGPPEGEVRFADMMSAQGALALTGTDLGGSAITVVPDPRSTDGTKVTVTGFGPQVMWQELKDHMKQCGAVVFADVKGQGKSSGKSFGKGQGSGPGMGEVRMSTADEAFLAVQLLNGSQLGGGNIAVTMHANSTDNTKLAVTGLSGVSWQDLKDYFKQCGNVMHANVAEAGKGGGGAFGGGGLPGTGEVRYEDPGAAMLALQALNGSQLGSSNIFVALDPRSTDQSKLTVTGIAPGIGWHELKDHFASMGTVAFADWNSQDGTKLWLGGITPGTDPQEIKDAFAQFGPIAFANVNTDKGKGKGYMVN